MAAITLVLISSVCSLVVANADTTVYCSAGSYLVQGGDITDEHCDECAEGTFIEDETHRKTRCDSCTEYDRHSHLFVMLAKCTTRSDTKRKCRHPAFFYNKSVPLSPCQPCTLCERDGRYTGEICSDFSDAVCCSEKGMLVKNKRCVESVRCGVGQYLEPDAQGFSGKTGICRLCIDNRTNYAAGHTLQECLESCHTIQDIEHGHVKVSQSECGEYEEQIGRSCDDKDAVVCAYRRYTEFEEFKNEMLKAIEKKARWSWSFYIPLFVLFAAMTGILLMSLISLLFKLCQREPHV